VDHDRSAIANCDPVDPGNEGLCLNPSRADSRDATVVLCTLTTNFDVIRSASEILASEITDDNIVVSGQIDRGLVANGNIVIAKAHVHRSATNCDVGGPG